mgnify:CR=1 FL=1
MSQPVQTFSALTRLACNLSPRAHLLVFVGLALFPVAWLLPDRLSGLLLASVGGSLVLCAGLLRLLAGYRTRRQAGLETQIAAFVSHDASPSFTTNAEAIVGYQNAAATDRFGRREGLALPRVLAEVFANPAAVVARMQNKAAVSGAAREDMVTRRGHVRLAVHRMGEDGYLWRLEDMADRAVGGRGADTISLPMLTVSRTETVLFMNEALRRLVGERVRTLDRIFADLPLRPGEEHEVLTTEGPMRALVASVENLAGRREIFLLPGLSIPGRDTGPRDFEALPIALLRVSALGILTEANRSARALLGKVTIGVPLSEMLEGLGRPVQDWLNDALAGRAERRPEVLRVRLADTETYAHVTLTRVVEEGRPGLVAVLSDATQLKTLEAQFVQSQKMQAIGQLAGGIAHDFNNLLTAISGHCDLLLLRHDKGDPDYADLVQINQNANRAASLVGQLLAYSRKQTLKPKVIDLRDIMSDLTHLLNRLVGEKIELGLRHDPALRPIRADKRQLEQVIMNLVVNARDAMRGGGEIRIETQNAHLSEPLLRDRATVAAGDYVIVRVIDRGMGISADKLDKIFEPFFTTKKQGEGTGLGLSTAYGIVKQTGGFIFCDSVEGQGTTFSLYFPAHDHVDDDAVEPEVAAHRRAAPKESDGVVLLVEDEAPVRAFASRALRLRGYTVIEAESAEQALELLKDPALSVDVFVTDVIMPGMDGPSWVREALKDRPGTRVVFVSGYSEESLIESRDRIPNSVFLPKPFSLGELTATVQDQIH